MDIGRLRHPVEIEKLSYTQNPESGAMIEEWTVIGTDWASIDSVRGREFFAAQAVQAETIYRIAMRYRGDLAADMRIKSDGVTYEIQAVLPDNRRRYSTCMCRVLV